jgi:hypothetical protein
MKVQDGNKLIAEFMGLKVVDVYNLTKDERLKAWIHDSFSGAQWVIFGEEDFLKYHTSWDWLMPVVEKIEIGARVDIYSKACKISQPQWTVDIANINEHKIMAVWLSVVQFIQWHHSLTGQELEIEW